MRRMQIQKWKSIQPDGKVGDEDILSVLAILISNSRPEVLPRGIVAFDAMHKISLALTDASEKGVFELEEREYSFLKQLVESEILCVWGMNAHISASIAEFLALKQE